MASAEQGKFQTERGKFKSGKQFSKDLFHASIRAYILNNAPIPSGLAGEIGISRREITEVVVYERKKIQDQRVTVKL